MISLRTQYNYILAYKPYLSFYAFKARDRHYLLSSPRFCQVGRKQESLLSSSHIYLDDFSGNYVPKAPLAIRATGKTVTDVLV